MIVSFICLFLMAIMLFVYVNILFSEIQKIRKEMEIIRTDILEQTKQILSIAMYLKNNEHYNIPLDKPDNNINGI